MAHEDGEVTLDEDNYWPGELPSATPQEKAELEQALTAAFREGFKHGE